MDPETIYWFQIKAWNINGECDAWSHVSNNTATTGIRIPVAPTTPVYTDVQSTQLSVSWAPVIHDYGIIHQYKVEMNCVPCELMPPSFFDPSEYECDFASETGWVEVSGSPFSRYNANNEFSKNNINSCIFLCIGCNVQCH